MDGIINIMKPPGMTSHDVIYSVRRSLKVKKAGHTGTLDPGAAGVLVVCLGRATRLAGFITDYDKEYRAEIVFGTATDTGDSFGKVIRRDNPAFLTETALRTALPVFTGEISQTPPMTSAIKVKGKKLYELARAGITVERQARRVTVKDLVYISGSGWGGENPRAVIHVTCSKGTYIRTLCDDLGKHLGCAAHMSFLMRVRLGVFNLRESILINDLWRKDPAEFIIPMEKALPNLPEVIVKSGAVDAVKSGCKLFLPGVLKMPERLTPGTKAKLLGPDGLLAIAETAYDSEDNSRIIFKPLLVFSP